MVRLRIRELAEERAISLTRLSRLADVKYKSQIVYLLMQIRWPDCELYARWYTDSLARLISYTVCLLEDGRHEYTSIYRAGYKKICNQMVD